jgi:hypothetical protein
MWTSFHSPALQESAENLLINFLFNFNMYELLGSVEVGFEGKVVKVVFHLIRNRETSI